MARYDFWDSPCPRGNGKRKCISCFFASLDSRFAGWKYIFTTIRCARASSSLVLFRTILLFFPIWLCMLICRLIEHSPWLSHLSSHFAVLITFTWCNFPSATRSNYYEWRMDVKFPLSNYCSPLVGRWCFKRFRGIFRWVWVGAGSNSDRDVTRLRLPWAFQTGLQKYVGLSTISETVMNTWILTFSAHTNYYKFSAWALKFLKTTPTSPVNAAGSIFLPNVFTASEDQPWWHQLCIPENFTAKRWRLPFYVNLREMEKIKSIKSTECIRGLRLCWCNAALGRAKFSDVRAMNQMNHWHCDLYTKVTYTPCSCPIKELTLTH